MLHGMNVTEKKALILFASGTQFISALRSSIFFYLLVASPFVCL